MGLLKWFLGVVVAVVVAGISLAASIYLVYEHSEKMVGIMDANLKILKFVTSQLPPPNGTMVEAAVRKWGGYDNAAFALEIDVVIMSALKLIRWLCTPPKRA